MKIETVNDAQKILEKIYKGYIAVYRNTTVKKDFVMCYEFRIKKITDVEDVVIVCILKDKNDNIFVEELEEK